MVSWQFFKFNIAQHCSRLHYYFHYFSFLTWLTKKNLSIENNIFCAYLWVLHCTTVFVYLGCDVNHKDDDQSQGNGKGHADEARTEHAEPDATGWQADHGWAPTG